MVDKITLYALGRKYDITQYIDPLSIAWLEHLEINPFDSGTFLIHHINKNELLGLDMSRPIPTYSLIEIILENGEVIQGYVTDDLVSPIIISKEIYTHEVNLVEPIQLATKINIPAKTITQPKSPGYLSDRNLIARTSNTIKNEQVFTGNSDGVLAFLSPEYPLTILNGKDYQEYNFHHKDNKFIYRDGKGVALEAGSKRIISLNTPVTLTGDNKSTLMLELDLYNPQYNATYQYYSAIDNDGKHTNRVMFTQADVKVELEVLIGNTPVYKDTITLAQAVVINGYWYEYTSGTRPYTGGWKGVDPATTSPYQEGINEAYILPEGRLTGGPSSTKGRYNILVNTTDKVIDPSVGFTPGTKYDDYKVYLHDYRTQILRTINIPKNLSGDVEVKLKVVNTNPWQVRATSEYQVGVRKADKLNYPTKYIPKKALLRNLTVSLYEETTTDKRVDQEIEKVLQQIPDHNFYLNETAKARLSELVAPELTYDQNNLYEVLADLGLFSGAKPKLIVHKEENKTFWKQSDFVEFNNSPNKLYAALETTDPIRMLNTDYKHYPLGVAIQISRTYEFETVYLNDYNAAENKIDLAMSLGGSITETDLWHGLRQYYPHYYQDKEQLLKDNAVIKMDDIGLGVRYFRLIESTDYFYAITEELPGETTEYKEIDYIFYDDIDKQRVMPIDNRMNKSQFRNPDEYVSSLELNVNNLIDEDNVVDTGWLQVVAATDDEVALSTGNLGLKLPNGPIYKLIEAHVRVGKSFKMEDDSTVPIGKVFDISNSVLEEAYFKTLVNKTNYTLEERLGELTMGQALYYKQGDDRIYNLTFTGEHKPIWQGTPIDDARAMWEIIARAAVQEYGVNINKPSGLKQKMLDEGKVTEDLKLRFRFKYVPYTSTRTSIYKDDQSGFQEETSRYYNAQQKLNNPSILGKRVQDEINKIGNTHEEADGTSIDLSRVPQLATKDSPEGRSLVSINKHFLPKYIDYVGTYIKDYGILNEYFGIDSAYRSWEVPKDDVVTRIDKKATKFFISPYKVENPIAEHPFELIKDVFRAIGSGGDRYSTMPTHVVIDTYDEDGVFLYSNIRPVNTSMLGKGLSHTYFMEDNYSAGSIIKEQEIAEGEPSMYQVDKPYTDFFGSVKTVKLKFYQMPLDTNMNIYEYPERSIDFSKSKLISTHEYVVNKDARETMAFSQDIKFFTGDPETVTIYEGLAKYSAMSTIPLREYEIAVGILTEPLSKSATTINRNNLIEDNSNLSNVDYSALKFKVYGSGVQVVYYNTKTLEPLLTYTPSDPIEDELEGTLYINLESEKLGLAITTYTLTWLRDWDDTLIKEETVINGMNGKFPSASLIDYGENFSPDGYIGNYTKVTENRVIRIKRKFTPTYNLETSSSQQVAVFAQGQMEVAYNLNTTSSQEVVVSTSGQQ